MNEIDQTAQGLLKSVLNMRGKLFKVMQSCSQEDYGSAVRQTLLIQESLASLLQEINTHHLDALKTIKFSGLEDDLEFTRNLSAKSPNSEEISIYNKKLLRLKKLIDASEREIKWMYDITPWPLRLWKEHWRKVLISIFILVPVSILLPAFLNRQGLKGEYFSDQTLTQPFKTRVDRTINFDWQLHGPFNRVDDFSIRWSGTLIAPFTDTYEIATKSDDGVRLWLDDKLIIDNWTRHTNTLDKTSLFLIEGPHSIRLEYFENRGEALMKLLWRREKSESDLEIIPAKQLRPLPPSGD